MQTYTIGIDVGTSGVKTVVLGEDGQVAGRGEEALPAPDILSPEGAAGKGREQEAEPWWQSTFAALQQALRALQESGGDPARVMAICVDGTSGTVVPVESDGQALRPGLMYNDGRSSEQAARLNEIGAETLRQLGYRFNASFGLAKILWLSERETEILERTACFLHQADTITARLTGGPKCGVPHTSDESNALKSGYDILERRWPAYLSDAGVDVSKLPKVVAIGETIGTVSQEIAEEFGLPRDCRVVGGMSDGTAACVASGARRVGDVNTTLGSTIVWKMVASSLVCDPAGRLYSHRHPGGWYLPGGAGNSGGESIRHLFQDRTEGDVDTLLKGMADKLSDGAPCGALTYPLPCPGERFPFVDAAFEGFSVAPKNSSPLKDTGCPTSAGTSCAEDLPSLYRSCLQGIACIERWGYEVGRELGAEVDGEVWTTGKGAALDGWMRIRADLLDRPVCRVACPESAYGSALVAAMNVWHDGSWDAVAEGLIRAEFRCEPRPEHRQASEEYYGRFREECERRR